MTNRLDMLPEYEPKIVYGAVNAALFPLIPPGAKRFLDVGCGTGALVAAIRRERETTRCEGITHSEEEARQARGAMARVWVQDINSFDFDNVDRFDCIICSHVLEHLYRPGQILQNLRRHVAPGGALLVALPNVLEIKTRMAFMRGRFRYAESGTLDRTHYRFFDRQTAYDLVRDSGYRVDGRADSGYCPLPLLRRLLPRDTVQRLDAAATKLLPGLLATQFLFRGRPAI